MVRRFASGMDNNWAMTKIKTVLLTGLKIVLRIPLSFL
jgi:hypothetical protein